MDKAPDFGSGDCRFESCFLIFWCLKRARWKKFPPFRIVPKWCVFQPDLVTVLKGMVPTFFFTNGVNYVIHLFSFISLGGWRPVLMSGLNICEFLGPPGPKKGPKIAQNDCKDTVTMSGWKTHHVGTTMKDRSFFHLALLRHQNIKTSLNFLKENHWARPFFALFSSVREKLQLTVSLNHPVTTNEGWSLLQSYKIS